MARPSIATLKSGIAAVVFAVAATATAQGVTGTTIVLGQSVPLSGSNKDLGEDIRNGALAYFKKVNDAGGVNGRKIELVTLDDANDIKRSGENGRKLIEENGVLALFGYASATLSRPALPHVQKNKTPFLSPFTGADPMRVFNPYVYNMRASYADELEKIVEHYARFGTTRFAIVHYDDAIGKENFTAVERALKARNLAPVSVAAFKDRAKPEIDAGVQQVLKGEPDVIILTTLYKATSDFIKTARKAGSRAQMVSNSFPGSTPLANELGKEGAGVVVAQVVPSPARTSLPIVTEYRAAIEKHLGAPKYSFTSLEAYIAAKVTVEAIRRAGPQLTRDSLVRALDNMSNYDTGGYNVGFSSTNHNGSKFVDLTIIGRDLTFKF
ncbi:MAG TPA: ABC transporter substrate-binding protein [Casimicrobiaceae bacterium]|nr:ABC transporter substrate-binding protein [Casimicrobiaceae bacterium]